MEILGWFFFLLIAGMAFFVLIALGVTLPFALIPRKEDKEEPKKEEEASH